MEQTEHIKLSQWAPEDRIRREDFNSDNAKVETALAALSGGLAGKVGKPVILRDKKSDGGPALAYSANFLIDNWSDWEYVAVLVDFPSGPIATAKNVRYIIGVDYLIGTHPYGPALMLFCPHHDGSRPAHGLIFGGFLGAFTADFSFQEMQGFDARPDNTAISPSVTFVAWA